LNSHRKFLVLATLFQGGLLIAGFGIALAANLNLVFEFDVNGMLRGGLATLPMLVVFWYAMNSKWAAFEQLRIVLIRHLGPLIAPCSTTELVYLSMLAGFSEEILFRGAIQNGMLAWGLPTAVIASNLLFGLCHAATKTYFLYAMAAGLYLSWVAGFSVQNLSPAILTHSLYDLIALSVVRERAKQFEETRDGESPDPPDSAVESSSANV